MTGLALFCTFIFMIREEFITAAGVWSERLLLAVQELPESSFTQTPDTGGKSVHELFAAQAQRGETTVRELERLFHGQDIDLSGTFATRQVDSIKKTLAGFRIAHSTVMAALERMPIERLMDNGEVPTWLLEQYLYPLEQMVPAIESWAADLRSRGHGGPTGLPVLK